MGTENKDAQLVFKAEQSLKTELEGVAKALDISSAKILRDILADALPKWREKADAEVRQREQLPHGITPDVLEKALTSLLRKWSMGGPLSIELHNVLGAESKALWVLLGFIWKDEPTDADRRASERLAALVAKFTGDPPRGAPPRK